MEPQKKNSNEWVRATFIFWTYQFPKPTAFYKLWKKYFLSLLSINYPGYYCTFLSRYVPAQLEYYKEYLVSSKQYFLPIALTYQWVEDLLDYTAKNQLDLFKIQKALHLKKKRALHQAP